MSSGDRAASVQDKIIESCNANWMIFATRKMLPRYKHMTGGNFRVARVGRNRYCAVMKTSGAMRFSYWHPTLRLTRVDKSCSLRRVPRCAIACYSLVRSNSIEGFLSSNRPSTDALNAVGDWSNSQPERSHTVRVVEDKLLVVELSWSEADDSAGSDLDEACRKFGVDRSKV